MDNDAPVDGTGFSRLQDLAVVETGAARFLVAASSGTNGLISYQIASDGSLSEADSLFDTTDTRFKDVSTLEVFSHQNRSFVVTAGSDDAVTLIEILSDGTFHVHDSIADTYTTTLDDVTALTVEIIEQVPVLFVGSGTDHGFTQFILDIPAPPDTPAPEAEFVFRTCYADTLNGDAGNNRIYGFGGADTISDEAGQDTISGGGGADVFLLDQDGEVDFITDFRIEAEHIDFSNFTGVTQFSQLQITDAANQVVISAGGELLILETADASWGAGDLTADQFLF